MPGFLTKSDGSHDVEKEKELKERFRKFWMTSVADAFKSDLEEIQKVCQSLFPVRRCLYILTGAKHDKVKTGHSYRLFGLRRGRVFVIGSSWIRK